MIDDAVHQKEGRDAEVVGDVRSVIFGHDSVEHGFSRFPRAEQLGGESTLNLLAVARSRSSREQTTFTEQGTITEQASKLETPARRDCANARQHSWTSAHEA